MVIRFLNFRRLGVLRFTISQLAQPSLHLNTSSYVRDRSTRLIEEIMGGDDRISDGTSAFKYIISGTLAGFVQVAVGEKKKRRTSKCVVYSLVYRTSEGCA